ncbi:MAG: transcriptional regulator [Aminipila sp.]
MKSDRKLKKYIPLVEFLGTACGRNFEVILHDISNPKCSVIAVKNGHLSGRKIGDPMTDLSIKIMNDNEHLKKDFIANYEGRLKNGKIFVSSTYFIKEDNELIGMLCINHDPSIVMQLDRQVKELMNSFNILSSEEDKASYTETLDGSINNISYSIIHKAISRLNVQPFRMTPDEKIKVIKELERQGIFTTKGSISQTAKELNISEPTVYRYLKKIRNENSC